MTHQIIPSGSYGEALPSGEYAVLIPGKGVQTHLGLIPLDPRETGWGPLYVRVSNVEGFRFAGQSHGLTGKSWLWDGKWTLIDNPAYGVSGAIFDRNGKLVFATTAVGSQGYRQVGDDGRLITGDQSYYSQKLNLFEYTTLGGIAVGQGPKGGALIVTDKLRRMLLEGNTRFIRFNRSGDRLAVAIWTPEAKSTHLFWFSAAEISSLPLESTPPPPPPPPPMPEIPDHKATVVEAFKVFASLPAGPEKNYQIVNYVAWKLRSEGCGLFQKAGALRNVSGDVIIFKPRGETFDIIGKSSEQGLPVWNRTKPTGFGDVGKWVAPSNPIPPEQPPPVDPRPLPPPVVDYDDSALRALIAVQKAETEALKVQLGDVKAQLAAIRTDIDQIFSMLAHARVVGDTSRTFAHGHRLDLVVTYDLSK